MTTLVVRGPGAIEGTVKVPGDKSISHRALMISAIAEGRSEISNVARGHDVVSTINCLHAYGVDVVAEGDRAIVEGKGLRSWQAPAGPLDCGNSGTTMRLLSGLAAHHAYASTLDGDESLRTRPMERLVQPLGALGARVRTTDGHAPITVEGGALEGAHVETGVASAQVKTAVIFAALAAEGRTSVSEPALSRDHTERMLAAMGASLTESLLSDGSHRVELDGFAPPSFEIDVPGDPSSAAFLVAAAVLAGKVRVDDVGLNPTRTGFVETLVRMGADISSEKTSEQHGEPVGTVTAQRSRLWSIGVEGPLVPAVLDELPLLAVVATQASGTTTVAGASELRVKESDRITAVVNALRALGAQAEELPDGFTVHGPTPLVGTKIDAAGDHRVAMAMAVAGIVAEGETYIDGFECASVSWPDFEQALALLGADIELRQ